jgi:hypothetical protein
MDNTYAHHVLVLVKSHQAIVAVADISQRVRKVGVVAIRFGKLFDIVIEIVKETAQTLEILRPFLRR